MILPSKPVKSYFKPIRKAFLALATTALMTGNALARDESGTFPGIFPISFFKTTSNASFIQSIQSVSISLSAAQATNTATISAVTVANAFCVLQGSITSVTATNAGVQNACYVQLTNGTTVTVTRNTATNTCTVNAVVIEFSSGVNVINQGTIAIASGSTSNTATFSAVSANAFVIFLGSSPSATASINGYCATVELTNTTTVTATVGTTLGSGSLTVAYVVVDLSSTIIKSVQKLAKTDATTNASYTDTITSVTTGNSLIFNGGVRSTMTGANFPSMFHTLQLTNGTTVTYTRSGALGTSRTVCGTVVEFQSGVLNSSVQRNTVAISAATSNTATITSVNTSKSFANYCGWLSGGATPAVTFTDLALTNATTVTINLNSSGSSTLSYEVAEFI